MLGINGSVSFGIPSESLENYCTRLTTMKQNKRNERWFITFALWYVSEFK